MPIHNRCGCGVEVITGDHVGQIINHERYLNLKSSGAIQRITDQRIARRAKDAEARSVEAAVAHHGELGPVLVDANQHFTRL